MIITKNESRCIARCIKSFEKYVDEILVSDTGSTDDTVRIAKSLGAKVTTQKWENDFALARNRLLDEAGDGGWFLFLDADEFIEGNGAKKLRRKLESIDSDKSLDAVWTRLVNLSQDGSRGESVPLMRVFRASEDIRYTGAIHETLRKNGKPLRAAVIPESELVVLHDGYTGARSRDKAKRNIELLKLPCGLDEASRLFHLGKAYVSAGDEPQALDCFLNYLNTDSDSSPITLSAIIDALSISERLQSNQTNYLIQTALDRFPSHPTPYLFEGDRLYMQNSLEDALKAYQTAFDQNVPELDFSSNLPKSNLDTARLRAANILYLKGLSSDALDILSKTDLSQNTAGLDLAVRCLSAFDTDFAVKWLDSAVSANNPQTLEILLKALYNFSGGMLFLIYFERYYKLTGLRDLSFPIMQTIVGEYSAAISDLSAWCKQLCPLAGEPDSSRFLINDTSLTRSVSVRRRLLAAALMSGDEREILFARKFFGSDMASAIDLALGREVGSLPHGAFEDSLGVFSEMLRLGGFSGAARVWLEVLLLFGGDARLRAAESLNGAGFAPDALDLISDYPDDITKKDALFLALRVCVRLKLAGLAKNYASLSKMHGCGGSLFEQFARWAEAL